MLTWLKWYNGNAAQGIYLLILCRFATCGERSAGTSAGGNFLQDATSNYKSYKIFQYVVDVGLRHGVDVVSIGWR